MSRRGSDYTEKRLCHRAEWAIKNSDGCIGYPRRSVEGRMLDDGGVLPSSGFRMLPVDADAEQMEALVVGLSQKHPEKAQAVKIQYLNIPAKRSQN